MTKYLGGLKNGIETYLTGKTTRKFGILVIDEQGGGDVDPKRTVPQLQILSMAFQLDMQVVIVEINPAMDIAKRTPTRSALTAKLPDNAIILMKKSFNAFAGDDYGVLRAYTNKGNSGLDGFLRQSGVNELIIMGTNGEQCVKLTAIGGSEQRLGGGPLYDGAIGFGYQVWTCPQIINTNDKDWLTWFDLKGVKCYTAV